MDDEGVVVAFLIAVITPVLLVTFADGTLPFGFAAVALLACFAIDAALVWSVSRGAADAMNERLG